MDRRIVGVLSSGAVLTGTLLGSIWFGAPAVASPAAPPHAVDGITRDDPGSTCGGSCSTCDECDPRTHG